ncbi:spermidine/putrescine ABC transporter substrate-binding protein [Tissierella sp. Yu-01]|uniref:ABC transporter substrate-binding protein n=1 Tax=Tissierella sp. Yu-01 TaxID=3035694 RepID=UPI00240DEF07|nr:spermidine/putrescine ABC transporter substrate-binding protein [Tissierella sp. Yu-01]WFA09456.1 spermidine/putrescine ABC transporter substrate-binding protein [Tissierella sp. Yu-01]
MKKYKSIFLLIVILSIAAFAVGCGENKPKLNVYNWGDYIDTEVLDQFEEEYGIKVVYDTFATNEDLYVKLKQGGSSYDVIFPSDYMIERMIREDLLVKIDRNNIPNLDKIGEQFLNLSYDPTNDYSVPYMWGTVGIIYNKTMVDEELDSWADLWNEKYEDQIIMLNSQRDSLAVALKKLGYSLNSRNENELEEAKAELIKQKPLVYAYMGDEVKEAMISGEAAIAVVWSGDAVYMKWENPDLEYVIPEEGTNLWFDSMVIPKNSQNKEAAEKFIDFMTRPDIAAKNVEYIGYSSPVPEAVELLDEETQNDPVAYPSEEDIENTEVFNDPADIIQTYDRIWTEITSEE